MIDLHTHLLPSLDDGPATIGESVDLAKAMVEGGTDVVVATPHVSARYPTRRPDIAAAAVQLREALVTSGVKLDVREGAEVELFHTREMSDAELRELRIDGRRWLLVEPPLSPAAGSPVAEIEGLLARGHHVMLAHVERCPALQLSPAGLRHLVGAGVLVSVTASSLTGSFGARAQHFAEALVRERLVHNIASDAHDLEGRPPTMVGHMETAAAGLRQLRSQAGWLTGPAAAAILVGATLPPRPRGGLHGSVRRIIRRNVDGVGRSRVAGAREGRSGGGRPSQRS